MLLTKNSLSVNMSMSEILVNHDSSDENTDWISMSELSGKVNNRKSGVGGRRFVSALRQLKDRYLTRLDTLTDDDSSGLLADTMSDDEQL